MSLITNGTDIPSDAILKANNIELTKITAVHNNVSAVVWEKGTIFTEREFVYNGDYGYDGTVQEWEVPLTGTYQLEVYGAQGGSASATGVSRSGGKGGYAVGTKYLTAGQKLYICIGGTSNTKGTGGYNGGGKSWIGWSPTYSPGGGATHIALDSNRGELKNYKDYQSEILLVAGGGGGSMAEDSYDYEEEC